MRLLLADNWLFAHRPLSGQRELIAEARRLAAIAASVNAIEELPRRRVRRRRQKLVGPFPTASHEYLKTLGGWKWTWVAAERRGRPLFLGDQPRWQALTWCSLLVEGADTDFHLGVQVFARGLRRETAAPELRRAKRTLVERMAPSGYRAIDFHGIKRDFFMVEKPVRSLPHARRERHRLDRLVFGD